MMSDLDRNYWNSRYQQDDTPWDIGHISTPIKELIDKMQDKSAKVLIPGAGRAYEAVYMHQIGFTQVYVCDWAEKSFDYLRQHTNGFPEEHLIIGDFFEIEGHFDFIVEQTFFCAIDPSKRKEYAQKAFSLLVGGGVISGLLFAKPFDFSGPPFGGKKEDYLEVFSPYFEIIRMEIAENSISPRANGELIFEMKRKGEG